MLVIPGLLPGLNEYIETERAHRQKGAAMKRQVQRVVELCAKKTAAGLPSGGAGADEIHLV